MSQKYKFFIKNRSVTFAKSSISGDAKDVVEVPVRTYHALEASFQLLTQAELEKDVKVIVDESLEFENLLFDAMPVVTAAGGFVRNPENDLLMIHRRGFWDLPKGKIESGESLKETAIREVEEECGIEKLEIISEAFYTYHIYSEKNVPTIKRCVWYAMKTSSDQQPVPQEEEDIVEALWASEAEVNELLPLSYPSIQDVIHHFRSTESSVTSGG